MLLNLISFAAAAIVIVLLPGPDTLVVVRSMVRGGAKGGILTSLGVLCGLLVWVGAAAFGLAALLHASEVGYEALKIAGACYLVWMGVQSLRSFRQTATELTGATTTPDSIRKGRMRAGFLAGFLTDILNPKVGVFFVSFLPGFVPAGYSVGWTTLALGGVFIILTALYCAGLVAVSGTIAGWLQTPRIRRRVDALTGLVLVGFGVRLATEA